MKLIEEMNYISRKPEDEEEPEPPKNPDGGRY